MSKSDTSSSSSEVEYRQYLQSVGMPYLIDDLVAAVLKERPKNLTKFIVNFVESGESDRFYQAQAAYLRASKCAPPPGEDNGDAAAEGGAAQPPARQKAWFNRRLQEYGGGNINWRKVAAALPVERTEEAKQKRLEMFRLIDCNGNGYLSLAEIDKGMRDILNLSEIFDCKPCMMRAFQRAKNVNAKSRARLGEDFVTKSEFRALLVFLRKYFELFVMFDSIDADDDRRLTLDEFKSCLPELEKWGLKVSYPDQTFKKIDKNGGGIVLFDEFCEWAIGEHLQMDDALDGYDDDLWKGTAAPAGEGEGDAEAADAAESSPPEEGDSKSGGGRGRGGRGGGGGHTAGGGRGGGSRGGGGGGRRKMAMNRKLGGQVNWEALAAKLPSGRSKAEESKRRELFDLFDPNGNHYLSLAEVDKGLRDIVQCDEIFDCKPAIMRAFQAAKNANKSSRARLGDDYVTRSEFRVLLEHLRRYFMLFMMFDGIDADDDRRLDLKEFVEAADKLKEWGLPDGLDLQAEFKKCDKNGGGFLLFDEFCIWALDKNIAVKGAMEE